MDSTNWKIHNPGGNRRVIVTKNLPGNHWLDILAQAGCRVDICLSKNLLTSREIRAAIGDRCDGAIGQLTESWTESLFAALKQAGGRVFSNYAVGYDNVDLSAAMRHRIAVGNTPGVLTEATAEMAVALTFAAARRLGEAERFIRSGRFKGWLPDLFVGELLQGKTLGIIGAGRIGSAYAKMMVQGHRMHLIYFSPRRNADLETFIADYAKFLECRGEPQVTCRRADQLEDLLRAADCVSLHTSLNDTTRHMINAERLNLMRENAVLVNTSRGAVIDEAALVAHCRTRPAFRAGLDVFEDEPALSPGLTRLENVAIMPHVGSATMWTRRGMATLAAANVAGVLMGYPAWRQADVRPFLGEAPPKAAPSIVNARALGMRWE